MRRQTLRQNRRPVPGLFEETINNIIELKPTQFTSVPAAFGMLAQHLEQNPELRAALFERVKLFGYGGAALGQDVYKRIQELAVDTCGQRIHFSTGCGSTETGVLSTIYYWTMETMGHIGLPPPGTQIKLVPSGDRMALWIKGDQVTPGYLNNDAKNVKVFDDEGYYDTGDAVTWVDAEAGVMFAGRVAENFKLANGTWVISGRAAADFAGCAWVHGTRRGDRGAGPRFCCCPCVAKPCWMPRGEWAFR